MTQTEIILKHMKRRKTITSLMAMTEYGIMRLASRIHDLKRSGFQIKRERKEVVKKNGEIASITVYSLA